MTLEIIQSKNYLIIVNEGQIKHGDYFWDLEYCLYPHRAGDHDYVDCPKSWRKIAAHFPLNGAPVLEGVPMLPQIKVRELSYEERVLWFFSNYYETGMEYQHLLKTLKEENLDHFKWYDEIVNVPRYGEVDEDVVQLCEDFYKNYETPPYAMEKGAWRQGYSHAKQKYKYTEEDLFRAFSAGARSETEFHKVLKSITGTKVLKSFLLIDIFKNSWGGKYHYE